MPDYVYTINEDACVECGQCRRYCPIPNAIIIDENYQHTVVADVCTGCGVCEAFCPVPNTLVKTPLAQAQSAERIKALRETIWRTHWQYHEHPVMGPLTQEARQQLSAFIRAARQARQTSVPLQTP
jgi:MinD superfamily P-loop ATPase